MMGRVIGTTYTLSEFSWDKESKTLVTTLDKVPHCLRTLWDDSMDIGFGVRSEKTGNLVFFILDDMGRDKETMKPKWWKFKTHNPDNRPELEGLTALVGAREFLCLRR